MQKAFEVAFGIIASLASSSAISQAQCNVEETNPKRTVINGYVHYVGQEVGTDGSVIRLGDIAIRYNHGNNIDDDIIQSARKRRDERNGTNDYVPYDRYYFEVKAPGFRQSSWVTINSGSDSSEVKTFTICGQEVSISIAARDGLAYWVVSTF